MCGYSALLGMGAVRVAWPDAVCSFVCDACTYAIKNRRNRAWVGNVGVVGFEVKKLQNRPVETLGMVCVLYSHCLLYDLVVSTSALT